MESVKFCINLLIKACLSEVPSENLSFRFLTLAAKKKLSLDCLIETEKEMQDLYYHFLSEQGLLDFVDQLILPREEDGIRLSNELEFPMTIQTDSIRASNCLNLLGQIQVLTELDVN